MNLFISSSESDMKKFLRELFILISILSAVIAALNFVYYRGEEHDTKKMLNIPHGIQICNFGSSHGTRSFNYEDAGKNYMCFNFAVSGQSLPYDNRILMRYKDRIQKGATVFIVISHFSLFGLPDAMKANFLSKNRRYYKFLPPELIEHYDRKTDFYVNYMPALVSDNIITFWTSFWENIFFSPEDAWNKEWSKTTNRNAVLKHAKLRAKYFIEGSQDSNGRRIYNHEAVNALCNMIETCCNIGATPILITTPYMNEYNNEVRQNYPDFYADFYKTIEEITKNTGVKYYDYSSDARYVYNYELFRDSDHMNRKGARIFTANLLREALGIDVTAD